MANSLELAEERLNLQNELTGIVNQAETRSLEETENTRLQEIRNRIDQIDEEIRNIEKENSKIFKNNNEKTNKRTMKKVKLIDAINSVIAHRNFNEDVQAEMNAAKEEFRASGIEAQGDIQLRGLLHVAETAGAEDVATEIKPIEVAVRDNAIATKVGADWLTGLRGDIQIPRYSGSQVFWAGEVSEASDGAGAFDDIKLTPHRLTAYIDVSKQLLMQASEDVEAMLLSDITRAVYEKLDQSIFSAATGTTEQPAGIFVGATTGETALSAVTYENVLALEEKVELNNGHEYVFVLNPKCKFSYKNCQMASGLSMVVEGKEIDGYPYISSNAVVEKGIVCFNPHSLVIGQWGGFDITVDPYTLAKEAKVRLVINAWFDYKLRNNEIAAEIYN